MERVVVSTAAVSLDNGCCCSTAMLSAIRSWLSCKTSSRVMAEGVPATPTSSIGSPSFGPVRVARRNANDRPIPPAGLLAEAV
jgi:hypothetical protein